MVADGWMPRMPDTLDQLDGLLLTVPTHRTVHRDGIHFQGQRYLAPTLAPFVGHAVTIRYDPRDVSEIRVYDHDTFVCVAVDEAHPNIRLSLRDIEAARRARRHELRRIINDRIPTVAHREEPRLADPARAETTPYLRGGVMSQNFIVTKEHRRFTEFANAVRKDARSASAMVTPEWKDQLRASLRQLGPLEPYITAWGPRARTTRNTMRSRTAPAPSSTHPKSSATQSSHGGDQQMAGQAGICIDEHLRTLGKSPAQITATPPDG